MQVTVNQDRRLFVEQHAGGWTSCLGFDYTLQQLTQLQAALAKHDIQIGEVSPTEIGSVKQYEQYREAVSKIGSLDLGTWFDPATPEKLKRALETARKNRNMVRVFYGDPETGKDSLEEWEVVGRIGRSSGALKIPLLVPERDSGGPSLREARVVRLVDVESGRVLYSHPAWHLPELEIVADNSHKGLSHALLVDGLRHARFKSYADAAYWVAFVSGKCNSYS